MAFPQSAARFRLTRGRACSARKPGRSPGVGRDRHDLTGFIAVPASVPGASHTQSGQSNQDAYALSPAPGGIAVAVADGLGSARCGGSGAQMAVRAAVDAAGRGMDAVCAATEARLSLESVAQRNSSLRAHACTLIICISTEQTVEIAHIGDGGVAAAYGDSIELLSDPGDSEYADETDPLTSRHWLRNLRHSVHPAPTGALALFTDGCQRAALVRKGGWKAHPGFFIPLFEYVASEPEHAAQGLEEFLAGEKMSEHSDDDKTLAVVIPEGNLIEEREWTYTTTAAGA